MYVSGMLHVQAVREVLFLACGAIVFINYYFIFASTCRWKVGVRAVVSAAVSGEDRAATILPAYK